MLRWALVSLVIALIAAVLGFSGLSPAASDVAQLLCFVFLGIFVLLVAANLLYRKQPSR